MPKLWGVDNILGEGVKVWKTCSGINLLYLGYGALNNMPTNRAARKENRRYRVLAESNGKPQMF